MNQRTVEEAHECRSMVDEQIKLGERLDRKEITSAEFSAAWDLLEKNRLELAWRVACAVALEFSL